MTTASGLAAAVEAWPAGTGYAPEIMGPGVALLDHDGDGDLDILQLRMPPPGATAGVPALLFEQSPEGTFAAGQPFGEPAFAQGVTAGDVDADGDVDLFLANWGPDALYLNEGDGRFVASGGEFGESAWSSSAAFCDVDADGDLDLYVARYLRYDPGVTCLGPSGAVGYCDPKAFDGLGDRLFRNEGQGRFVDATSAFGLTWGDDGRRAKGLGVACVDLTGDGRVDIYVANDGEANQLWVGTSGGTFVDEAVQRGLAVNRHGRPEASMGIAIGDATGDGEVDLLLTHLQGENNTLYAGGSGPLYRDRTPESGMPTHDLALTGFGCALIDFDLDGDQDFAVVNGRVRRGPTPEGADLGAFWNRYAEPNQLFENDGAGFFANVSGRERPFSDWLGVTRGLAFGDVDNDGDPDIVVANADNSLRLYRNVAPRSGNHWLRVRALDGAADALGSRVTIVAGERRWPGFVLSGSSYMSHNDNRVLFGLGSSDRVTSIEVVWPDGARERFSGGAVDREVVVRRGQGESM